MAITVKTGSGMNPPAKRQPAASKRVPAYRDRRFSIISDDDDSDNSDASFGGSDEEVEVVKTVHHRKHGAKPHQTSDQVPSHTASESSDALVIADDQELDDDLVDAVISKEEEKLHGLYDYSAHDDSEILDLQFDFDKTAKDDVIQQLNDEDLGEVIEDLSQVTPKSDDSPALLEVPKFDYTELNSDADYEFDPDDLIRTLQNDDDEVELELLGNSDEANISSVADEPILKQETEAIVKQEEQKNDEDDEFEEIDLSGYKDLLDRTYVPQSAVFSESEDDDNDDDDADADAQDANDKNDQDSEDDSNLIQYFFSSDESSDGEDSEATDEDTSLPRKSTRKIGSKRAKEVLSSSKNNFRAPKLGTFLVSRNKKPFGIIDGYSTRFLMPRGNKLSILKGAPATVVIDGAHSKSQRPKSGTPVSLEDLLNISEFEDEGEDVDDASNFEWDSFFKEKRIPLTAFRNRGLLNNSSSYADATRKYKFEQIKRHHHHHHHHKDDKARSKSSRRRKGSRRKEVNFEEEFVLSPSQPVKLKKGSKRRIRRKSMAEAQSEGLRTTKSGLFNEDVLKDVEEVMVDLGAGEEYGFLFAEQ